MQMKKNVFFIGSLKKKHDLKKHWKRFFLRICLKKNMFFFKSLDKKKSFSFATLATPFSYLIMLTGPSLHHSGSIPNLQRVAALPPLPPPWSGDAPHSSRSDRAGHFRIQIPKQGLPHPQAWEATQASQSASEGCSRGIALLCLVSGLLVPT